MFKTLVRKADLKKVVTLMVSKTAAKRGLTLTPHLLDGLVSAALCDVAVGYSYLSVDRRQKDRVNACLKTLTAV